MEYRTIHGLKLSRIGLGGGQVGEHHISEKEAETLLNQSLDEGITLIDTARAYGLSEERIGKYVSHRRDEFILSTKGGYGIGWVPDWSYESIKLNIEEALVKLKTDHIDIFFLHSCSKAILERGEAIRAVQDAVQEGKVLNPGYSGENDDLEYAIGLKAFNFIETSVNICDQNGIDSYLPSAKANNMGIIAKRPIANGFWRFGTRPEGQYCLPYWERAHQMNLKPDPYAWDEFALRFTMGVENVDSLITGTGKAERISNNIRIAERGALAKEDMDKAREAFSPFKEEWFGEI